MRVLLAAFVLLTPLTLLSAPAAPAGEYAWEAPAGTSGPLAVEVVFDLGAPQSCTLVLGTAGATRASPVLAWEEVDGRAGPLYSTNNAQAHVGAADTRTLQSKGGAWAMESTYERTWERFLHVVVVVPQAAGWGGNPAMGVRLACPEPVALAYAHAGREAVSFTADGMTGGTGANLNALIFVEATLTRGDGLAASFASDHVWLSTFFANFGSRVEGELRLDAPSGRVAWDVTGGDVRHADGPGDYALALDYTAAGPGDTFVGVLYGTNALPALDLHADW